MTVTRNPSRGVELGYAESTSTFAGSSLAATNFEDVTGLTITFTAGSRPVLLEAGGYTWQSGTTNVRPELQIADGSNTVYARHRFNADATTIKPGPYVRRRVQLTAGTSYTFKVRLGNGTGGTTGAASLFAATDAPSWIQATEV